MKIKSALLKTCIFIMIFFSSIVGGQILGVSLNKISMLPLLVYLLATTKNIKLKESFIPLACFYALAALSSLVSLLAPYANSIDGYVSKSLFYAIQMVLLYIPMLILLSGNNRKTDMVSFTIESVVITSRINIVMVFVEFFSYFAVGTSFTNAILKLFYGIENASALIYLPSLGVFLRPTGLNMDPAYLGIILVFGFVFEKKLIWRIMSFVAICCSMSRSSLLIMTLVAIVIYVKYNGIKKAKSRYIFFAIILVIAAAIVVTCVPGVNNQIVGMLSRLNIGKEMKSEDTGTLRHLLYIPKSLEVYLFQYNPIQKIIGFGPRLSGTIIAQSNVMNEYLVPDMFSTAWATECDISELLLGYGLLGFLLYYFCLLRMIKVHKYGTILFIIYFLYSIMYDISASTYAQLIMMVFLSSGLTAKGDTNAKSKCSSQLLQ